MKRLFCLLVIFTFANAAQAEGPVYSYVRAGYTEETLTSNYFEDISCPGYAVDFSMALSESFAMMASHYECEGDDPGYRFSPILGLFIPFEIKQELNLVGALYHMPLGQNTDLAASIEAGAWESYRSGDFFFPIKNEEENGYRLTAGIKSRLFKSLEGGLSLRRFQFLGTASSVTFEENIEDEITEAVVEGNYYFGGKFSLGFSYISNDSADRFVVSGGYVLE